MVLHILGDGQKDYGRIMASRRLRPYMAKPKRFPVDVTVRIPAGVGHGITTMAARANEPFAAHARNIIMGRAPPVPRKLLETDMEKSPRRLTFPPDADNLASLLHHNAPKSFETESEVWVYALVTGTPGNLVRKLMHNLGSP